MMLIRLVVVTFLTLLSQVLGGRAYAAESMLFRASSFLTPAEEATLLTKEEKTTIDEMRAHWRIKSVLVTRFDALVIGESTIPLELPDHSVYRFEGAVGDQRDSSGYFTWWGRTKPVAGAASAAAGTGTPAANTLALVISRGWNTAQGTLIAGGREFAIQPLNTKFLRLTEKGLNPSAPPIDAEPAGSSPKRPPRSGADWPAGLLTDALKASISTSSIGRSLSPGYCNKVTSCGEVTQFSCHPEFDGAEMYFNNKTGALIMACGGTCMAGPGLPGSKRCTACPPPEWERCEAAGKR